MEFKPHKYQQDIIDKIRSGDTFVIAQMGGGKTAATLEALSKLKAGLQALIIAPLRVASHTWPDEINKWDNFKSMPYALAVGPLSKRTMAIDKKQMITIINRENIPWLVKHHGKNWPYDVVVIDESSSFKSASSQRFKALKKVRKYIKRVVLLTGTPAPNSLLELWSQVFLLDEGTRLGKSFHAFKQRYFESDYMGYKWTPRAGAERRIYDAIRDLCVVVESYDGLPDRLDLVENVKLSHRVQSEYDLFEREQLMSLNGQDVSAVNAAVLSGKLAQFASGAVYDDDKNWHVIHNEKLDALESLLEQAEGENVLVAYNYRHEYERIKAKFPHAVDIKEPGAIDQWNRGAIKLLLAHPASAGHGLNLWSGGHRIIWFSPTWSNELKLQFDARLYRQGQTNTVFIHTLAASGTLDYDIIDAVQNKKTVQQMLIEKVKK